jgi:hypothetical protein
MINLVKYLIKMIIGLFRFTFPISVARLNLYLRARQAKTFSGKVAYKMLHDRNPLMTMFADKLKVRDYVSKHVGPQYLVPLLWSGKDLNNFDAITALDNYVVKPNHGSHAAVIVSSLIDNQVELPKSVRFNRWSQFVLNPANVDFPDLVKLSKYWLTLNYYWEPNKLPEWAYLNIEPMIMVEQLLVGSTGGPPDEFRFFMVHGRCELIYRFSNRFGSESITLFDAKGVILEGKYLGLHSSKSHKGVPDGFEKMLEIAEILSREIDFIRVDLYVTDKGLRFSELTNYPMGGLKSFHPKEIEHRLSINWKQNY